MARLVYYLAYRLNLLVLRLHRRLVSYGDASPVVLRTHQAYADGYGEGWLACEETYGDVSLLTSQEGRDAYQRGYRAGCADSDAANER